jgi:HAD superfamily hydrolase (TIGR01549 family)
MRQAFSSPFWHPAHTGAFILDWDGVLADTRLDFSPLRRKYFGGKIIPLTEAAELLPDPEWSEAKAEIRRIEMAGADRAVPVEGAKELISWLRGAGRAWAVVSRNCRDSILLAAERCGITLPPVLLSREDPHVKPAPEALALAARKMKVPLSECVMVGDFIYDLLGARRAAVRAVLVRSEITEWAHLADVAWPTVKAFVESLSNPSPLIPWEYHDLARQRGTEHLEAVARNVYRLNDVNGAFRRALVLAGLGALRFAVPEDAKLGIDDWKDSSLPVQTIDMPLSTLLQDVMAAHWPCVKIVVPNASDRIIEVPPLNGPELENFLLDSLK